jgi:hypothetical protein
MQLITVESSMIHAVGYDPKTQTLEAVFHRGSSNSMPVIRSLRPRFVFHTQVLTPLDKFP